MITTQWAKNWRNIKSWVLMNQSLMMLNISSVSSSTFALPIWKKWKMPNGNENKQQTRSALMSSKLNHLYDVDGNGVESDNKFYSSRCFVVNELHVLIQEPVVFAYTVWRFEWPKIFIRYKIYTKINYTKWAQNKIRCHLLLGRRNKHKWVQTLSGLGLRISEASL